MEIIEINNNKLFTLNEEGEVRHSKSIDNYETGERNNMGIIWDNWIDILANTYINNENDTEEYDEHSDCKIITHNGNYILSGAGDVLTYNIIVDGDIIVNGAGCKIIKSSYDIGGINTLHIHGNLVCSGARIKVRYIRKVKGNVSITGAGNKVADFK